MHRLYPDCHYYNITNDTDSGFAARLFVNAAAVIDVTNFDLERLPSCIKAKLVSAAPIFVSHSLCEADDIDIAGWEFHAPNLRRMHCFRGHRVNSVDFGNVVDVQSISAPNAEWVKIHHVDFMDVVAYPDRNRILFAERDNRFLSPAFQPRLGVMGGSNHISGPHV